MLRCYLLIKYGLSLVPVSPTIAINTKSDIPVIKNIFCTFANIPRPHG